MKWRKGLEEGVSRKTRRRAVKVVGEPRRKAATIKRSRAARGRRTKKKGKQKSRRKGSKEK